MPLCCSNPSKSSPFQSSKSQSPHKNSKVLQDLSCHLLFHSDPIPYYSPCSLLQPHQSPCCSLKAASILLSRGFCLECLFPRQLFPLPCLYPNVIFLVRAPSQLYLRLWTTTTTSYIHPLARFVFFPQTCYLLTTVNLTCLLCSRLSSPSRVYIEYIGYFWFYFLPYLQQLDWSLNHIRNYLLHKLSQIQILS